MTSRTSTNNPSSPLPVELELEIEVDEQDAEYLQDSEYDEEVCMRVDDDASLGIRRDLFGGFLGEDLNSRLQKGLDQLEGGSRNICVLGQRLWIRYLNVCLLHKSRLFVLMWGASTKNASGSSHEA
jgi:hypothetical protein